MLGKMAGNGTTIKDQLWCQTTGDRMREPWRCAIFKSRYKHAGRVNTCSDKGHNSQQGSHVSVRSFVNWQEWSTVMVEFLEMIRVTEIVMLPELTNTAKTTIEVAGDSFSGQEPRPRQGCQGHRMRQMIVFESLHHQSCRCSLYLLLFSLKAE